ncbi:hypothetical protein TNO020_440366 [Tenacibaculum piscium]|uniref:Uncharacterized protein n=2 Tax=Tenacibaculum piscium TaxID=1458515 RepID=A0A2H1YJ96_9FLAO|nr:hypothetical protein TNO020_440366 [Tenacibaculum piscium]
MIRCTDVEPTDYPGPAKPITFSNIIKSSHKEREFKVKFHQKEASLKNIDYSIFIENKSYAPVKSETTFKITSKDDNFELFFTPYEEESIGKELSFVYEVYIDNDLFIKKEITLKTKYKYPKANKYKNSHIALEELKVSNNNYIKEISKDKKMIILEF